MPTKIWRDEVQRLVRDEAAQLVEVLPPPMFEDEHIEGAVNIPLKDLTEQTPCSLGLMLLAATEKGVCTIQFGDDTAALEAKLQAEFPGAVLGSEDAVFESWVDAALALVDRGEHALETLPLDIQGTAFQHRVWRALQQYMTDLQEGVRCLVDEREKEGDVQGET